MIFHLWVCVLDLNFAWTSTTELEFGVGVRDENNAFKDAINANILLRNQLNYILQILHH